MLNLSIIKSLNFIWQYLATSGTRNKRKGSIVEKIKRENLPEYPEIILREVLINTLIHADYSPFTLLEAGQASICLLNEP